MRTHSRASLEALDQLARAGDADAMYALAVYARDGLRANDGTVLVRRDPRRAKGLVRAAAAAGVTAALIEQANELTAVPRGDRLKRGIALYRKAYRRGDRMAAFNLAITYRLLGRHRHAVEWFRRAGNGSASIQIAYARFHGLGLRRNARRALDREQCLVFVARALLEGWTVPLDHRRATNCLRRAAALGSREAQALLEEMPR